MALATYDAKLAKIEQEKALEKQRGPQNRDVNVYTGPKVKWEDTGLYKSMMKKEAIEEELTRIRNLIRKRTDPNYEPDDDDFKVAPTRKFDVAQDYYELLQVDDFATVKDIKGAYKKMALMYHPDKNRQKTADQLREMQDEFEKIQEAYEVLSDRATRRQYDRQRYDEKRAKNQGMGGVWKDKEAEKKDNYWSAWSAKKAKGEKGSIKIGTGPKLKKCPELVVQVPISLNKALRGGLKILQVKRARLQRSTGGAPEIEKTFHVPVAQGQAHDSELRMEDEGTWNSITNLPGDLVFRFRHKPHSYLRQLGSTEGALGLATPLTVKAKVCDRVLATWSPTFKGQMVLIRFLNPLPMFAPCKTANLSLRVPGEGLPLISSSASRGPLTLEVSAHLDGETFTPTLDQATCQDTQKRRFMRSFNHQHFLRADCQLVTTAPAAMVRKYVASTAVERSGSKRIPLAAIVMVWEAPPDVDPIAFAKASSALGWQAAHAGDGFGWGMHAGLLRTALPATVHEWLHDDEIASDDEDGKDKVDAEKIAGDKPHTAADSLIATAGEEPQRARRRPDVEEFLLKFNLGPLDGFPDAPADGDAQRHLATSSSAASGAATPSTKGGQRGGRGGDSKECEEEKELTGLIRQMNNDLEQAKRKFMQRKQRLQSERTEEETELRSLLEKDKEREMERIEKEMGNLRGQFENQVKVEEKWRNEFNQKHTYANEWVVVFKPTMAVRQSPKEEAQIVKTLKFNDIVKAISPRPTEDNWIQLGSGQWALTWHPKLGQLLQKWYGNAQAEYLELEKKIGDRRQNRNQTFIDYKRKKKEVTEWTIPAGPTEDEKREIADDEGEQLSNLLAPILQELKSLKRRLRELRQKRFEAEMKSSQEDSGALASGQLPAGFSLPNAEQEQQSNGADSASQADASPTSPTAETPEWETVKKSADEAFKQKDWHRANTLYTKALEAGGDDLDSKQTATLLSNRSLIHSKLDDWQKSLEDATDATIVESQWVKGWLRRVTAELRLGKAKDALLSLQRGMQCPSNTAVNQFLPLVTECEATLYEENNDGSEAPKAAADRIKKFRNDGSAAFENGQWGLAVLNYTRSLYHRAMMDTGIFEEARILSNRSAAFLKLELPKEALADALAASELDKQWSKPCVRAAQAALMLQDMATAYTQFAKGRRLEEASPAANDGVNRTLKMIVSWDYEAAVRRWSRFSADRGRARENLRIWALSDLHFDQQGAPEWCKSLSSSFYRDDVLMLAGNVADSLEKLKFGLTVLKSKFRRVFFVPGNQDLWVKSYTIGDIIKGKEKVANEARTIGDSMSKFLQVVQVCDELGIELAPAEVAGGVFIVPLMSWYSRDFVSREMRRNNAAETDAELKITIDQWVKWPFPCGSDDAWKYFMRMNEPVLRAALVAKSAFEGFAGQQATVLTMTHYLTRPELSFDWSVPGIWDHIGCLGLDEQARVIGTDVHVYGHSCMGSTAKEIEGVQYVHNYLGTPDKHRPGMAPFCVYDRGVVVPEVQPAQAGR